MHELIIQGIGFLGVLCSILSYQIKSNRFLYFLQTVGCLIFCLQFALMGQLIGSFSLIICIIRNTMIIFHGKYTWTKWKGWLVVLCLASIVVLIVTWNGPISLLPFIPVFACHMFYWSNNAQQIRLGNLLFGSPCWIIYDILVGNFAGIVNEAICLTSVFVSIYRYGWKAMGAADSEFQK